MNIFTKEKSLTWSENLLTNSISECESGASISSTFQFPINFFNQSHRCPNCLADISFKTDLENCDYQAENGATRLFEAFKLWKDQVGLFQVLTWMPCVSFRKNWKRRKKKKIRKTQWSNLRSVRRLVGLKWKQWVRFTHYININEFFNWGKLEEMQELNRRHEGAATTIDSYLEKTDVRLTMAQALKRYLILMLVIAKWGKPKLETG